MRRLLISALLLCSAPVSAQHLAPEDYIFPLRDVAGLYSANFGEMRPNHFHSGIDIKTDGVTGKPVLATADGYISRIAVTPGGYGRAIYITHPNGTTSVYGHLSKFRDDIEKYVHEERYRTRRNSINLYPSADRFPLKQGEQFAWSGNTGSSAGPHLHFEIRDSRTQRTLNTISSGVIRTRDDIPPRLVKLYYVEVDSVRGVPVHARPRPVELVEKTPGRYALKQEGALSVGGRGYFILQATDRKNDASNTFGLWRIREFADEDPIFELRIDGFAFDQTRYCNAVTHYPMQVASRNEVIRLTRLDGCIDDFYPVLKNQALLTPSEGQSQQIRIEAEDDCGNRSQLEFDILGRTETLRAEADSTAVVLRPEKAALVRAGRDLTARIPAGAVYEPIFCRPEQRQAPASDSTAAVLSPAYRILDAETPLRRPMTVSVHAFVPDDMQSRTVLATRTAKGRIACIGGRYADGAVTATTRTTGDIFVAADTIPPRIRPLFSEGADLGGVRSIRFRVSDNFSGIASCTLLIDGRWVPCDRFPMQGTLVHAFDLPAAKKRRSVQLTVTDRCGNTARWEGTFWR